MCSPHAASVGIELLAMMHRQTPETPARMTEIVWNCHCTFGFEEMTIWRQKQTENTVIFCLVGKKQRSFLGKEANAAQCKFIFLKKGMYSVNVNGQWMKCELEKDNRPHIEHIWTDFGYAISKYPCYVLETSKVILYLRYSEILNGFNPSVHFL